MLNMKKINNDFGISFEKMSEALNDFGISFEKTSEALNDFVRKIPPLNEEDINLIKANPSLSLLQKIRLIRQIRKSK